jgi:hypothetical protein
MLSEMSTLKGATKSSKPNSSAAGDAQLTGQGEFVAELKEMAQVH